VTRVYGISSCLIFIKFIGLQFENDKLPVYQLMIHCIQLAFLILALGLFVFSYFREKHFSKLIYVGLLVMIAVNHSRYFFTKAQLDHMPYNQKLLNLGYLCFFQGNLVSHLYSYFNQTKCNQVLVWIVITASVHGFYAIIKTLVNSGPRQEFHDTFILGFLVVQSFSSHRRSFLNLYRDTTERSRDLKTFKKIFD
jgi:hypothetical protein